MSAILVLTNEPTSGHGGIQRYVARLASALADCGERVTIVEPATTPRSTDPRIRFVRYAGRRRAVQIVTALTSYARIALGRRQLVTIASIWFPSGLVAALIPRALRGPLAILAHGTEIAPSRKGLRNRLMRWTYARAHVVLANSELTRGLLAEAGITSRVALALCGVDSKPLKRDPAPEPTLLMVGRLIARKGFDRTIEAMPAILAAVGDARLRIVGDGPQRTALEASCATLGMSDRVRFLGAIGDAELAHEYARAWCFVMPARRIGDDVEGFGIVYLEAAIAGLPSIGGRDSGAQDAIDDGATGMLVDGDDVAAIAAAAIALLRDREKLEAMGTRARERASASFTWAHNAAIVREAIALP